MAKKGLDLFGTPSGQRELKRLLRRHPEAAGRHLDVLSENEKKKFLQDAASEKARSRQRVRKKIPEHVQYLVFQKDHNRCHYCGTPSSEVKLQIDHVVPVSKGGSDDISNLVAACPRCNRAKSNRY